MTSIPSAENSQVKSVSGAVMSLFVIQIVSTLSFSVLYSTLVLYMEKKLGLTMSNAHNIMGVFVAFNYALHLVGGLWGGRLLSNRALFCLGMLLQMTGCLLLSLGDLNSLYLGLATFLTGSGLNVTCVNCMLTECFAPDDTRRETAFFMNYAGMNIGFFVGFSMSGIFQLSQDYSRLFLLSSIGNLLALVVCLFCWQLLGDKKTVYAQKTVTEQRRSVCIGFLLIMTLPFVLSQLLHYAEWSKRLVLITGLCMLVYIVYLARQQISSSARNRIYAFAILMLVSILFWMLYQIAPMGLTTFIEYNVRRDYNGWIIAPQWFQNINTVCIVIGGPLLAGALHLMRRHGFEVNIPMQFCLALFFIGLSFIILPLGIHWANNQGLVNSVWIVGCYTLQSLGELLISPVGYAMIGYLAPVRLQGMMMGMWMLGTGVGGTLSSYSSNWMIAGQDSTLPLATNAGYRHVFLILGSVAISASIILFLFIPSLKILISGKKMNANKVTSMPPATEAVSM